MGPGPSNRAACSVCRQNWRDVSRGECHECHVITYKYFTVTLLPRFTAFYSGQHSGRKLNWLYHMSKGELVTNCFKNKYTLQVNRC